MNTKIIQCIDCGEWFEVSVFDSATCRCADCYGDYRKQRKLETQKALQQMKEQANQTEIEDL